MHKPVTTVYNPVLGYSEVPNADADLVSSVSGLQLVGEGIPPMSDASFTKETHTRSLTQLPILGNMRQWTEANETNGELLSAGSDVRNKSSGDTFSPLNL